MSAATRDKANNESTCYVLQSPAARLRIGGMDPV
jgi:hypothetical protein